jgi:molecular chaperone GrpE
MVIKVKKDTSGVAEAHHKKTGEQHAPTDKTIADVVELSKDEDRAEDLKAKLQDAERKSAENYDKYLRSIADLDNFRKRAAREKTEAIQYGNEALLRDILPLVDGIDRALEHACNSEDFEAFKKGLKLLQGQLLCCLQKHGVEIIDTAGKGFDPHIHEAMMQVESVQHEDSQVVGEFERGYLLNGRLLRPAKVSVCKRPTTGGDPEKNCE